MQTIVERANGIASRRNPEIVWWRGDRHRVSGISSSGNARCHPPIRTRSWLLFAHDRRQLATSSLYRPINFLSCGFTPHVRQLSAYCHFARPHCQSDHVLSLALQYDGQSSMLRLVDTDVPNCERLSANLPPALQAVAGENSDESLFWGQLNAINAGITRQYECLHQITTLLIQFLISHEFHHLANHHHCFLKSLSPDAHSDEASARVSLEIIADAARRRKCSLLD